VALASAGATVFAGLCGWIDSRFFSLLKGAFAYEIQIVVAMPDSERP